MDFVFDSEEAVPHCTKCGSMVRPDVTLYGELLPEEAYQKAIRMIDTADCLIIGGTSLEVGSAAQLAHMYHGRYLIIINKGKTRMEGRADSILSVAVFLVCKQRRAVRSGSAGAGTRAGGDSRCTVTLLALCGFY